MADLRYVDLQDTVLESSFHLLGLRITRQADGPRDSAVADLTSMDTKPAFILHPFRVATQQAKSDECQERTSVEEQSLVGVLVSALSPSSPHAGRASPP